jgi:hypothetical protein
MSQVTCLCCGGDISGDRVKRLLQSEASKHVIPLWSSLFQEELNGRGILNIDALGLVRDGGRVCRKCFTVLKRCSRLLNDVKSNIQQAVQSLDTVSQVNACSISQSSGLSQVSIPRVGCSGDGETNSPDVLVSIFPLS